MIYTSQAARVLQQSPRLGPLVMMSALMVGDTARFLVLALGPMLGFAAAMVTLFRDVEDDALVDECTELGYSAAGTQLPRVLFFLLEVLLGSDNGLRCLRKTDTSFMAVLLMDVYLVLMVLLGTNMLIAIMAKVAGTRHPFLP